jgi:hypothetical protein
MADGKWNQMIYCKSHNSPWVICQSELNKRSFEPTIQFKREPGLKIEAQREVWFSHLVLCSLDLLVPVWFYWCGIGRNRLFLATFLWSHGYGSTQWVTDTVSHLGLTSVMSGSCVFLEDGPRWGWRQAGVACLLIWVTVMNKWPMHVKALCLHKWSDYCLFLLF